jgi:hydrogenase expression/formation protein HypC
MCVAIPGRIVSVGERSAGSVPACLRFGDTERIVDLAMVPEAGVGDYVIVHSGFAIRVIPEAEALRVAALFESAG